MPLLEESQQFERYRITRWLGNGVSGVSYEAIDTMLQRKVTLKLIHPWAALSDPARRQFFREMQDISLLNHAYLAPMLDYGEIDGSLYVVRRYVSSGSLLGTDGRAWFKPPFAVADAIHYGHQLAQALDHMHRHGYLHGALTFTNILVLRGANIDHEAGYAPFLLADIGLANFVRRFGQPLLPLLPITAAPEQLAKRVTPASDQFALAVLLYFWLAGRPPYLGTPQEVEHLKLSESFPTLSSLNSQITTEQESILHRALRVSPEERHSSVLAFTEALLATLASPMHPAFIPDHTSQPETISQLAPIPQTDPALFLEMEQITPFASEAVSTFDFTPQLEFETIPEPEALADAESDASLEFEPSSLDDTETVPEFESSARDEIETISELEASSQVEEEAVPEFEQIPHTEPPLTFEGVLDLLQQPTPEPLPVPPPDPLPQPAPEPLPVSPDPLPQPAPKPLLVPAPEPLTQPTPEPLPQPAPDISQPLPEAEPTPLPQTETPARPEPLPQQEVAQTELAHPATSPCLLINLPSYVEPYEFLLEREETLLGHAGSDDVLLDQDSATSRHHALLKHEENYFVIYDQRSANGVFVNGQKLANDTGCTLLDGDHITIGNYELIFHSR